jgi:hypothetical protein
MLLEKNFMGECDISQLSPDTIDTMCFFTGSITMEQFCGGYLWNISDATCPLYEYIPDQRSFFSCHHQHLVLASVQTGASGPHSTAFLQVQPRITRQ